jgi:hypothetical protein
MRILGGVLAAILLAVIPFLAAHSLSQDALPRPPSAQSEQQPQSQQEAQPAEATEYWTLFGHRLKITDALLVFVGVVQAGFFFWQLRLMLQGMRDTKKAADAAKEAADAAKVQAEIARRSFTELERPWLFVEGATVSRGELPNESMTANNWFITFRCRNVGRSPAVVDECITKLQDRSTLPSIPNYAEAVPCGIPRWVAPNEPFKTEPPFGPAPINGMKDAPAIQFIVYGRITYRELNGAKHHTGFAVAVSPHMPAFSSYPSDAYNYYD